MFETIFENNKLYQIKPCHFKQITDHKKRDFIASEFLKTKAKHPTKLAIRTCR